MQTIVIPPQKLIIYKVRDDYKMYDFNGNVVLIDVADDAFSCECGNPCTKDDGDLIDVGDSYFLFSKSADIDDEKVPIHPDCCVLLSIDKDMFHRWTHRMNTSHG